MRKYNKILCQKYCAPTRYLWLNNGVTVWKTDKLCIVGVGLMRQEFSLQFAACNITFVPFRVRAVCPNMNILFRERN